MAYTFETASKHCNDCGYSLQKVDGGYFVKDHYGWTQCATITLSYAVKFARQNRTTKE